MNKSPVTGLISNSTNQDVLIRCTAADRATFAAVFAGVLGALGTGIGVGIDALVTGHRLLYENPPTRAAAFEIVPSFGTSRSGLALALRW